MQHHGSQPPWQLHLQTWQCMICGCRNPMAGRECEQCTYPIGYQKLTPQRHLDMPVRSKECVLLSFLPCVSSSVCQQSCWAPTYFWPNRPNSEGAIRCGRVGSIHSAFPQVSFDASSSKWGVGQCSPTSGHVAACWFQPEDSSHGMDWKGLWKGFLEWTSKRGKGRSCPEVAS